MTSSSSPAVLGDYTMAITEPQAFERFPELSSHILRMAISTKVGSLIEWDGFLKALNDALDQVSSPKTAIPAPADGQVASQRGAGCSHLETRAFHAANTQWPVADYQQLVRDLWKACCDGSEVTDQSSDVSGLVEALEKIEALLTDPVPGYSTRIATARAYISTALAQAKRDGGAD